MAKPFSSFDPLRAYVLQLSALFERASKSRNPALFLYTRKARQLLFMAESLLRLLDNVYNQPVVHKARRVVKKLEDNLGRIDDFDGMLQRFSKLRTIKQKQLDYFTAKRDKQLEKLNRRLKHKQFYQVFFTEVLADIRINIHDKDFIARLKRDMQRELRLSSDFYKNLEAFTDMETQVHELRRRLRWVSMYGESLGGVMRLKPATEKYVWEKEFITRRELDSPYNKLPLRKGLAKYIDVNKKAFYALSFVISELGNIKDEGLALPAFEKALKKTSAQNTRQAHKQAVEQLKPAQTEKELLLAAHGLLRKFFVEYTIHQKLL